MKLNKTDIYNLGQLQLAREGALTDDECMNAINWGNRRRARTQSRYLKRLVEILGYINKQHNLSQKFDESGENKLELLKEKNNV